MACADLPSNISALNFKFFINLIKHKVNILIISRNAWNDDANNTLSNIFQNFKDSQFATIYCRDESPKNSICQRNFKITESWLIKSLIKKLTRIEFSKQDTGNNLSKKTNIFSNSFFKNYRFTIFLWFRELLWKTNIWKTTELKDFIEHFKPDIIYTDGLDTLYTYDIALHAMKISHAPLVLFHSDDHASFYKFSLSPLFWINRIILRNKIRKMIHLAERNYFIIDGLGQLYSSIFNTKYNILTKCYNFDDEIKNDNNNLHDPLKLIYAGNLIYGRYETLLLLIKSVEQVNKKRNKKIILNIYTNSKLSNNQILKLSSSDSVFFHGSTSYTNVQKYISESDIVLHIESLQLKQKLLTAYSFSTKIIDYFKKKKCILAIGFDKSLSIKYLKENSIGIVATRENEILDKLNYIIDNQEIIHSIGSNGYNHGKIYHNTSILLNNFKNDLISISTKGGVQNTAARSV